MQKLLTVLLLACAAAFSLASAQSIALDDKAINAECPIGKRYDRILWMTA